MKVASCRFHLGARDRSQFPSDGRPEIAFLGRSNVGKSSLINSLIGGARLARVSRTPGRTQQVHFYLVNDAFYFVDLPGYGYARAPARVRAELTALIEEYLTDRRSLAVAIHLVDSRHEPMPADLGLAGWLRARRMPAQVVLTKVDKIPRSAWQVVRKRAESALGAETVIMHSSVTGEGRKGLWQIIEERVTGSVRSGR